MATVAGVELVINFKAELSKGSIAHDAMLTQQDNDKKCTESVNHMLFQNNVQQVFQRLHVLLQEEYSGEDLQIIACPSMEQVLITPANTNMFPTFPSSYENVTFQ